MKNKKMILAVGCLFIGIATIHAQRLATYQKEVIECLGVEGDGSQTLRVTGTGRNKADAFEQAKKDAVMVVIFDGIRGGLQGCDTRPLLNEMNARDKYEDYFNIFFMDKGEYRKYVSMEDRKRYSQSTSKNKYFKNYRVTVRVLRSELKTRLKADGIIR